jgi:hypothetical protein
MRRLARSDSFNLKNQTSGWSEPFLTLDRKALSEPSLQSLAVEIFALAESLENRLGRFYHAKSHRSTVMKAAKNVR